LNAIQYGWEQELRVERGWINALRMLEATRERTQLAIEDFSGEHAEREARQVGEAAMEHRVNTLNSIIKQSSFSIGYRRESNAPNFAETIKMLGLTFVKIK
jgi:hypothetical protein